ncbi:isoprenyl transferase [Bacillus alveayuensis]|jgi:undecaprenyl diphosphate synthase|uniref:Isoprenyl transferase n=1 Tax=Aeribacillus alveayuensis TaxID=279215 RepID=A0ABT9VLB6_9BACI|nr:isoprenyl transferase [Bacillus alveayuensis]MDQ0161766.1 undecaprenyl diphosphate synthase [Bacillus alveayuensis]
MFNFIKKWTNSEQSTQTLTVEKVKEYEIPEHVAIIMDGNGRWAKKRSLPRMAGHHEGMKVVRKITKLANELEIKVLTLYAFSTENWKRPKTEVDYLMKLPEEFLNTFLPELVTENVQVHVIGDLTKLPEHTQRAVQKAMKDTENNTGLVLNFALNYGSRAEILQAVKEISKFYKDGVISLEEINEQLFSSYLMTSSFKDPDLLIRTSGELRLSNFLLWQLAYTEFWFTDVFWPDFSEQHFLQAIRDYQQRGRRFGGV